jgi:cyanuric acid amidohydrolase
MFEAQVHTVPMGGPDDVSAVAALFDSGEVDPNHVVAVIAQTEGDGYARGYSALALSLLIAERLQLSARAVLERIPMLMIGGTAGLMSPHHTLFVNKPANLETSRDERRLAIGVASSRTLKPEEYGTAAQIELVAEAVRQAMKNAGIPSPDDVCCVEMKCPQMTAQRKDDAVARGKTIVDPDPQVASAMSRGASALGAALALGELAAADVSDAIVGRRPDLFTSRGSASSGSEQNAVRVVVLGNVTGSPGDYVAGNSVMQDQLDLPGARAAFTAAGLRLEEGIVLPADRPKIAAVFVNAGADSLEHCRRRRHTMRSDFLAQFSGHAAKAVAHASISGIAQDTRILANAGAEHQGAPGSNLVCVIARHG